MRFVPMTPEQRPQDDTLDGDGWTFETAEHGGDLPDQMPQVIIATDPEGSSSHLRGEGENINPLEVSEDKSCAQSAR